MGVIRTYQKCPKCGAAFSSSKGFETVVCPGCRTRPTKYFIKIYCKATGKDESIYCDRAGKPLREFEHAAATLGEIRNEINRNNGVWDPNVYKKQSKTSFQTLWEKFQSRYKDRPGAHDKLRTILKHHMVRFKEYQMRDITSLMVDDWWEGLKEKGLSAHYANDILQWIVTFFRYAQRLDVVEKPPHFPLPLDMPEPEVEDWLTVTEQLQILDALPSYDRPVFDFLFLTGVRVSEACALRRSDIYWNKGEIVINSTVKRDGTVGIVKNKKRRVIPLVADIEGCLKQAVKLSGLKDWVFVNRWGRRYSDDYLRDRLNEAAEKALGRRIKAKNSSRHSIGNQLAEQGYTMDQIRVFLNQSNARITRHYVNMRAKHIAHMYGRPGQDTDKGNLTGL